MLPLAEVLSVSIKGRNKYRVWVAFSCGDVSKLYCSPA